MFPVCGEGFYDIGFQISLILEIFKQLTGLLITDPINITIEERDSKNINSVLRFLAAFIVLAINATDNPLSMTLFTLNTDILQKFLQNRLVRVN